MTAPISGSMVTYAPNPKAQITKQTSPTKEKTVEEQLKELEEKFKNNQISETEYLIKKAHLTKVGANNSDYISYSTKPQTMNCVA